MIQLRDDAAVAWSGKWRICLLDRMTKIIGYHIFDSCTTPCHGTFSTAIHKFKTSNLASTQPLKRLISTVCFFSPIASRCQGKARWSWGNFLYDAWASYTQQHVNFPDDRTVFNAWQFLIHLKRLCSFFTYIWIKDVGEHTLLKVLLKVR